MANLDCFAYLPIGIRQPDSNILARDISFKNVNVKIFFNLLKKFWIEWSCKLKICAICNKLGTTIRKPEWSQGKVLKKLDRLPILKMDDSWLKQHICQLSLSIFLRTQCQPNFVVRAQAVWCGDVFLHFVKKKNSVWSD